MDTEEYPPPPFFVRSHLNECGRREEGGVKRGKEENGRKRNKQRRGGGVGELKKTEGKRDRKNAKMAPSPAKKKKNLAFARPPTKKENKLNVAPHLQSR